jgi:hypothetical protein
MRPGQAEFVTGVLLVGRQPAARLIGLSGTRFLRRTSRGDYQGPLESDAEGRLQGERVLRLKHDCGHANPDGREEKQCQEPRRKSLCFGRLLRARFGTVEVRAIGWHLWIAGTLGQKRFVRVAELIAKGKTVAEAFFDQRTTAVWQPNLGTLRLRG